MLLTCVLTVFSAMPSSRAISLFGSPRATSAEHLALARREAAVGLGGRLVVRDLAHQPRGDGRVEQRLAGVDGVDRPHELRRARRP